MTLIDAAFTLMLLISLRYFAAFATLFRRHAAAFADARFCRRRFAILRRYADGRHYCFFFFLMLPPFRPLMLSLLFRLAAFSPYLIRRHAFSPAAFRCFQRHFFATLLPMLAIFLRFHLRHYWFISAITLIASL